MSRSGLGRWSFPSPATRLRRRERLIELLEADRLPRDAGGLHASKAIAGQPFGSGWLDAHGVRERPADVLLLPDGSLLLTRLGSDSRSSVIDPLMSHLRADRDLRAA